MPAYRATIVWTLRLLAVTILVVAVLGLVSPLLGGELVGDAAVIAHLFFSTVWAALLALALVELIIGDTMVRSPLIWTMRVVAAALLLTGVPTLVRSLSEQFAHGTDALTFGYSVASLLIQPATLLALTEILSTLQQRPLAHGSTS